MALEHTKSAAIVNLEATPAIANQAGKGAPDKIKEVDAVVTMIASDDDSTHQFVRVPTTAIIKEVLFTCPTVGSTGAVTIGVYYPDDVVAANAIVEDFFVAAIDISGQSNRAVAYPGMTETLIGTTPALVPNTAWTMAEANLPLWQALGLTADPGGYFDIVATNTAAIATGAAGYLRARYTV